MRVEEITKAEWVPASLPDGTYTGSYGGYIVTVLHNGEEYRLKVDQGVRGMNYRVTVSVINSVVAIKE